MKAESEMGANPDTGSEYRAGAACALQAGIDIPTLVAELQRAAEIVEAAGHSDLASKLRNWAICVAAVVTSDRQGERSSEVYVG